VSSFYPLQTLATQKRRKESPALLPISRWIIRLIPQPKMGQIGQKDPGLVNGQIPISTAFITRYGCTRRR